MEDALLKYGLAGIFILILIGGIIALWKYIERKDDTHKKERDDWKKDVLIEFSKMFDKVKDMHDDIKEVVEEDIKATKETSNILTALKTILENRK